MTADRLTILRALDERTEMLVSLCAELIQTPSPNPPGDTTSIAELVQSKLTTSGLQVARYAPKQDSPNLVCHLGAASGPSLIINGHLDHFPPAAGNWEVPPYSGARVGDRVMGCGATDMRAGLAVAIFIAQTLTSLNVELAGRLSLLFSSDEETGGQWGTGWVMDNVAGLDADACLIGDQSGPAAIAVGEKGMCWLRLTARGERGHAAYASRTGAIRALLPVLNSLVELEQIRLSLPPGLSARPEDGQEMVERVTVNIGTIHSGEKVNLAPDIAVAEVDIRVPLGMSTDQLLERVATIVDSHNGVSVEHVLVRDCNLTDISQPLVLAAVANSAEAGFGASARPIVRVGSSDSRYFRSRGIPTVVVGASPTAMGAVDEYVTVAELRQLARIHMGIVIDLLGIKQE